MDKKLHLVFLLNQVAIGFNKQADILLKQKFSISYQQYLLLACLDQAEPCSQKQLAEFTMLTSAGVLHLLTKLQGLGWVRKHIRHDNRRAVSISLTKAGQAAYTEMNAALTKQLGSTMALSDSEITKISEVLVAQRNRLC